MKRRYFFRLGLAGSALAWGRFPFTLDGQDVAVSLIVDPLDPIASSGPAQWALGALKQSLEDAGQTVRQLEIIAQARENDICIVVSGSHAVLATEIAAAAGIELPNEPESLILIAGDAADRQILLASGADTRGLVYALLELKDRVRHAAESGEAFVFEGPVVERPANTVRSLMKQFTSELLDKPWFYDKDQWSDYLTMLATHRFNRFHLAFGLGYDFLQRVTDSYLLFLYPFLLSVPGYEVRMSNLSDTERDRNLEMLRFISAETVARGMEFQLGIWTHGYFLANSPGAQHVVEGLTDETHAAYCRDALTAVLKACPAISAVALRIHGESGIAEGSYDFWATVFDGVPRSGRRVEIDLHAKGIDSKMINNALATGMPVNVSPKLHAEHLGMPYHQAAIREWEMPAPGQTGSGLMTLSEGQRSFTRYGYADLLRDDRAYTVRHRVFSGTQRVLAWGDAEAAAAYSRSYSFCGSTGMDLMEPLTCRGRRGTGIGTRIGYADTSLAPKWDWEKYALWYRTNGRQAYHPQTTADVFARAFRAIPGGRPMETSLALASRILPIITTAHLPSAACDAYWPEIYWNQPIVEESRPNPYFDAPAPTTFQNVSALDPQMFSRMSDFAGEMLQGARSGKYTPIDVAQWLEDLSRDAMEHLADAGAQRTPSGRRLAIDIEMQALLGQFFATKFRAGVLFAVFEQSQDGRALEQALANYRRARNAWAELADLGNQYYEGDLSASDKISERGQWTDRLAAIDQDIAKMAGRLAIATTSSEPRVAAAIGEAVGRPEPRMRNCTHTPPNGFGPGRAVDLALDVEQLSGQYTVTLYYRHVNQAERHQRVDMERTANNTFRAAIPATYTDSPFPLQYYFEVRDSPEKAWLYPGLGDDLLSQPYFVLVRM